MQLKHILVTGGGGYLGSVLVPMLLKRGYQVTVLDRFFFGRKYLEKYFPKNNLTLLEDDVRWYNPDILNDVFTVIDLAALSNDPIAELQPEKTFEINFKSRTRTAKLAKKRGIKKYILASSCSVYGKSEKAHEKSPLNPLTTYAKASCLAEESVLNLCDKNFNVTVLRQGTLYGISPRMRFDLVLNTMTLNLFKKNYVIVKGGNQWRPIIHVKDSAQAFIDVLESRKELVSKEIFNVGSTNQNFKIKDLSNLILKTTFKMNPGKKGKIIIKTDSNDDRSYQVSFSKIKNILNFETKKTPEQGVTEIYNALTNKEVNDSLKTKTIKWYNKLLKNDPSLFEKKR